MLPFLLKGNKMADTNLVYPYEFEGGKKAVANEVNANFEAVKAFSNGVNATLKDIQTAIADLKNKPTREVFDVYYSFSAETPTGAYPLWTGETINNCKSLFPDFWRKLNNLAEKSMIKTVTAEQYEEKLTNYGQCASFFIDTLNGHVRLPKITRFISSIADLTQLAEEQNDCNKSHSHNLKAYTGSGNRNASETRYLGSGTDNSKSDMFWSDTTNIENTTVVVNSGENEAHPKNVRLCLYIQVANNITEIAELNTDVIIEQLNSALEQLQSAYDTYVEDLNKLYERVKKDISNASPVVKDFDIIVNISDWSSDTTYPDYPYKADIENEDATEDSVPLVVFSVQDAMSGNFAPVSQAFDGYVRIWAKEKPNQNIQISSIVIQ